MTKPEHNRRRRESLAARAELQRAAPRRGGDRVLKALRRHPAMVLLVVAGVMMLAPRRRMWLLRLAWSGWRIYRRVAPPPKPR